MRLKADFKGEVAPRSIGYSSVSNQSGAVYFLFFFFFLEEPNRGFSAESSKATVRVAVCKPQRADRDYNKNVQLNAQLPSSAQRGRKNEPHTARRTAFFPTTWAPAAAHGDRRSRPTGFCLPSFGRPTSRFPASLAWPIPD